MATKARIRKSLVIVLVVVLALLIVAPGMASAWSGGGYSSKSYGHDSYSNSYGNSYDNSYGNSYGKSSYKMGWYKVRRGDTLGYIAWCHGTSVHYLARMNGLRNPDRIYAGQWLRVPMRYGY